MTAQEGKQWAEAIAARRDPKPYPYTGLYLEFVERCRHLSAGETLTLGMTDGTTALEHLKKTLGESFHIEALPGQDRIAVTR